MKAKCHVRLGELLSQKYLDNKKKRYQKAFQLGCIEPDRNPLTYVKGSFRAQWLRGHNFENSKKFVERKIEKLQKKKKYHIWDYYNLGKVIHYTTDSFTAAHNQFFPTKISVHNAYEADLQQYFLTYLEKHTIPNNITKQNAYFHFMAHQRAYQKECVAEIQNDAEFVFVACVCIMLMLI